NSCAFTRLIYACWRFEAPLEEALGLTGASTLRTVIKSPNKPLTDCRRPLYPLDLPRRQQHLEPMTVAESKLRPRSRRYILAAAALAVAVPGGVLAQQAGANAPQADVRKFVDQYCVACHNKTLRTGGVALD